MKTTKFIYRVTGYVTVNADSLEEAEDKVDIAVQHHALDEIQDISLYDQEPLTPEDTDR